MSWQTSSLVLRIRKLGRAIGVNRLVGAFLAARGYEDRFGTAMLAEVRAGDVVWDVGANVGLYTCEFADRAGPAGRVFAFEPSPANLRRLGAAVEARANVTVVPVGLGAREGVVPFEQGDDLLGATSRIVAESSVNRGQAVLVRVRAGDEVIAAGVAASPDVVKIDTEGFELEVLTGLRQALRRPALRLVCIEVHFGLLEAKGQSGAPAEIEKLLLESGLAPDWVDPSHIVARRAA